MKPTTALESTPPERNAPIGTSLTICIATDCSSRARTASIHCASVRLESTSCGTVQ